MVNICFARGFHLTFAAKCVYLISDVIWSEREYFNTDLFLLSLQWRIFMSIYELIQNRRTIRRFKQETISYAILEKIVNAGRIAPSGSNLQPCEYIIVDDPQFVAQVYTQTRWAGYLPPEQGPPKENERPTAFIIILINRHRR